MNNSQRRLTLLLILVMMIQMAVGVQSVEAGRFSGFQANNDTSANHSWGYVCTDGIEFGFILNDETYLSNRFEFQLDSLGIADRPFRLPPELTINVEAAIIGENEIKGAENFSFTVNQHNRLPLEELANEELRAIEYSTLDSIAEGTGSIKVAWSEFGLDNPEIGDRAKLTFSLDIDIADLLNIEIDLQNLDQSKKLDDFEDKLDEYLNMGDMNRFGGVDIEDCTGDSFPAPPPVCTGERVTIRGRSLEITEPQESQDLYPPTSRIDYFIEKFQPEVLSGLKTSTLDIIGRLDRNILPNTEDGQDTSRIPTFQEITNSSSDGGEFYDPLKLTTISPDGYAYTRIWQEETGFEQPITITIASHNGIGGDFDSILEKYEQGAFPRAAVYYNVYEDSIDRVNIIRPLDRFVNSKFGIINEEATEWFTFPALEASTDITVTAVFVHNAEGDKPIKILAQAGSVKVAQEYAGTNTGSDLTIAELVLEKVPSGTDSLEFKIQSPHGRGDAALLSGLVVSYPCLAPNQDVPTAPEESQPTQSAKVRPGSKANLRSGPGTTYQRVSSLAGGTSITIYRQVVTDNQRYPVWYQLNGPNGPWIWAGLVQRTGLDPVETAPTPTPRLPATATPTPTPNQDVPTAPEESQPTQSAKVRPGSRVNLRSGPGTTYQRISSLAGGTSITIYQQVVTNNQRYPVWYQLNGPNGPWIWAGLIQ